MGKMRSWHSCKQWRTMKAACPSVLRWSLLGCNRPCPICLPVTFFVSVYAVEKPPPCLAITSNIPARTLYPDRLDAEPLCENHPLMMRRLGLLSLASRRRTQRLVSSHLCPRCHRPETCLQCLPVLRLQHPSELASGIVMHADWRLAPWPEKVEASPHKPLSISPFSITDWNSDAFHMP
jgi:hypothetical protein